MKQFCEEVLKFLRSEYNDAYQFEIEYYLTYPCMPDSGNEKVELNITISPGYKLRIVNDSMQYLYGWYCTKEFIKERNMYYWQKELIDIIEGS